MNIILSNDDGIKSKGLTKLSERLALNNTILVVAPDGNRSTSEHSLTINKPLKLSKVNFIKNCKAYSLSGTPVDCLKFAKLHFVDFDADVVVSGINNGHNIGSDVLYSGTVSIACEAAFFGYVAFAFSAFSVNQENFDLCVDYAEKIINYLISMSKPGDIWNVNFPASLSEVKGIKFTKLGKQLYSDRYVKTSDDEYQLVGELIKHQENDEDCDVEWLNKGYITITPILFNKTNYEKLEEAKIKCIKLSL